MEKSQRLDLQDGRTRKRGAAEVKEGKFIEETNIVSAENDTQMGTFYR